tara:strand:+ start:106 stop:396 length:291 start_codon:yes stop_codon:yes gene_type:complete
MENTKIKLLRRALVVLMAIFHISYAAAEETIIQQEEITFEKCLKVITTSEDKLSVTPKIEKVSKLKRVAVFTLFDGTLTITCDGKEGTVTVSVMSN